MSKISLDDVRRLLRECAGVAESVDINADISHLEFTELGYDSLALLEVTTRIKHEFGVTIPDEEVAELKTPGSLVDYVNQRSMVA